MKDDSSVVFYVKDYILCTKGTNQSANFGDFFPKYIKFELKNTEELSFMTPNSDTKIE